MISQAVNTLNDSIAKLMTTGSLKQANFSGAFKSIGDSLAKTALKKGESALLGGSSADGSQKNPWWVRILGGMGGTKNYAGGADGSNELDDLAGKMDGAGTSGSFGSSLISWVTKLLPGFADGTDAMVPGMPSIVGERGPELFVPPSAGAIVPNHKLGGLGGGSPTIHIDARGSNDPAQTAALVQRAIVEAAPHLVTASVHAMHEHNRRTANRG